MNVRIEESWKQALQDEWDKPYFETLTRWVRSEYLSKQIFPPGRQIFAAFDATPFDAVKVVILGQDPYHDIGQANGLCFSVNPGIAMPPSLINIFKEVHDDTGAPMPANGDLSRWARQGVLLLNTVLTVRDGEPQSHRGHGWEQFTDRIIALLNLREDPIVFLLWGAPAGKKAELVTNPCHLILKAPHPSPLSASRGFFGCRHFSQTNQFLRAHGFDEIDWRVIP